MYAAYMGRDGRGLTQKHHLGRDASIVMYNLHVLRPHLGGSDSEYGERKKRAECVLHGERV